MDTRMQQESMMFRTNRVRVYVTRDMSYNLEKMMKVTKQVLGKLGCDGCHSGRMLDFIMLEDFVVNPKTMNVEEVIGPNQFGG